jgi:hypothetical protein
MAPERRKEPVLLTPNRTQGYLRICLTRQDRSITTVKVHHLVLKAFVGPCPKGKQASHIDDNPWNARLSNLLWETNAENMHRRACSKLTLAKAREIRFKQVYMEQSELAAEYGVSQRMISSVVKHETWKEPK